MARAKNQILTYGGKISMAGFQGKGYKIDIAFVIDATGSMHDLMANVKSHALTMGDEIVKALEDAGKNVEQLRMRVIDFADYATEGDEALRQTDFFVMPAQKGDFDNAINKIDYEYRGGDIPENALEALYAAMISDWVKLTPRVDKGRHIIVLMTDAYPLHLMERKGSMGYPEDELPPDVAELQNVWNADEQDSKLSKNNKRLLLFAPEGDDGYGHSWNDVQAWENTVFTAVDPAKGLEDIPFDAIIAEIVRSC